MKPLRQHLLNEQISLESRRIAHAHTKTCKSTEGNEDSLHTKRCNMLKREIEMLAKQIKLAGLQR